MRSPTTTQYTKLAIFASGGGTNAQNIIKYFQGNPNIKIDLLLSNKPYAPALKKAADLNVSTFVFSRSDFNDSDKVLDELKNLGISWIILAGFLWLLPQNILEAFPGRIINIHPALLPKFGGKGMYGMNVHKAVFDAKEKRTGITIHYVNPEFDKGEIIFQAECEIETDDTPEIIAQKVHELEMKYFPKVIEKLLKGNLK